MFSGISSALNNTVSLFKTENLHLKKFEHHWLQIMSFFTDIRSSSTRPIENTKIPHYLKHMTTILENEEIEYKDSFNVGPCLEYFLKNKLSSTMCEFARADTPPGMKRQILLFFKKLILASRRSLLDNGSVHISIFKLIELCVQGNNLLSEREEIDFLDVLCDTLKSMPHLIECFFNAEALNFASQNLPWIDSGSKKESHLSLIKYLLILLHSLDSGVRVKSGINIVIFTSVINDASAQLIVEQTDLCETIIIKLINLFIAIPEAFDLKELRDMDIKWGSQNSTNSLKETTSESVQKVISFMNWYDLLNKITSQSNQVISDTMMELFKEEVIENIFFENLIRNRDTNYHLITTRIIICCLNYSSCSKIRNSIVTFLLDDSAITESSGKEEISIRSTLIRRCQNVKINSELAMYTLHLFNQILRTPTETILNNLVIDAIRTRSYLDKSIKFEFMNNKDIIGDHDSIENNNNSVDDTSSSILSKIPHLFLCLVPDHFLSCDHHADSYMGYVRSIQTDYQRWIELCQHWDWPKRPVEIANESISIYSRSKEDSEELYVGMFLKMLLLNLQSMLNLPYDYILLVTSLISRIASLPHPNITELLLNPLLPLRGDTKSLFSILLAVVDELNARTRIIPNMKEQIKSMRLTLLHEDTDTNFHFYHFQTLKSIILLEEFCKELAAIAVVKYNLNSSEETIDTHS